MKNFQVYFARKSMYGKVLTSILLALLAIIAFMEFSNLYIIHVFNDRAMQTYQSSINLYCSYVDGKFRAINNSLISMCTSEYNEDYINVCGSSDGLAFQTGKVAILNKLNEIVQMHDNKISSFCYIPSRNLYIRSTNVSYSYFDQAQLDSTIVRFIKQNKITNNAKWQFISCGNKDYLINIFHLDKGYVGALIGCRTILENLTDNTDITNSALIDSSGRMITQLNPNSSSNYIFSQKLNQSYYRIGIYANNKTVFSKLTLLILILSVVLLFGAMIMRVQIKVVLRPLNKLQRAMEHFSEGDMDVRLESTSSTNEIGVLYRTFNSMAEQIKDLKINVYEAEIEKQKIHSNFIKVQIQPHFYTNILNLIYGLAEIKDYKGIQQISLATSNYFRYLLKNKETLIPLGKELECVDNYVKIQSMRYSGMLEYHSEVKANVDKQLVPPLVLQTFVENSIKHNVTLIPMLRVQVNIYAAEGSLILETMDNGVGFSKDLLEKLDAGVNISENGRRIGIINVKQRLQMIYGEKACLRITSVPAETVVQIRIPENRTEELP